MRPPTICDRTLIRLIDKDRLSQAEAARRLGVSRQAIHKRLKELRGNQAKAVAVSKIDESINLNFDAMRQLTEINERALQLLDQAENDPELSLKCIGEVRAQIKLAAEIYERMFNIKVVHEFMELVVATLKEADPNVYADFKRRLNGSRAVAGAVRFT